MTSLYFGDETAGTLYNLSKSPECAPYSIEHISHPMKVAFLNNSLIFNERSTFLADTAQAPVINIFMIYELVMSIKGFHQMPILSR
jgi:hypothetical protein